MMRLLGDLHIHSRYSDGEASAKELVDAAVRNGLKVLSITDHNSFMGSIKASEYIREHNIEMILLYGNELRTVEGDVLVYCIQPLQLPKTLDELLDKAREENCIVVPAHPFDIFRKGIGKDVLERIVDDISGIECFNADALSFFNKKAFKYALEHGKSCMAGSDAHIKEYVGVYKTLFKVEDTDIENVYRSLLQGNIEPVTGDIAFGLRLKRLKWALVRRLEK